MVESIPSSVDPTLPLESEIHNAHVLHVTSDSSTHGGISSVSFEPHPRNEDISFDWNSLIEPHLLYYTPFQIIVKAYGKNLQHTNVDEGASISILS